jgi:hypothetical protein
MKTPWICEFSATDPETMIRACPVALDNIPPSPGAVIRVHVPSAEDRVEALKSARKIMGFDDEWEYRTEPGL